MAKKAKVARKETGKRKAAKAAAIAQGPVDTVSRITTVDVVVEKTSPPSKGFSISLKHLGIDGRPDVSESSGNVVLLDKARPPVIEGDKLLLFFDPDLGPGLMVLKLAFSYTEDAETVLPAPLVRGEYAGLLK